MDGWIVTHNSSISPQCLSSPPWLLWLVCSLILGAGIYCLWFTLLKSTMCTRRRLDAKTRKRLPSNSPDSGLSHPFYDRHAPSKQQLYLNCNHFILREDLEDLSAALKSLESSLSIWLVQPAQNNTQSWISLKQQRDRKRLKPSQIRHVASDERTHTHTHTVRLN